MDSPSSIISYDCVPLVGLSERSFNNHGISSKTTPLAIPTWEDVLVMDDMDVSPAESIPVAIPSDTGLADSLVEHDNNKEKKTSTKISFFIARSPFLNKDRQNPRFCQGVI